MSDTEDHKTKMQAMQKTQREKIAEAKDAERGLVLTRLRRPIPMSTG